MKSNSGGSWVGVAGSARRIEPTPKLGRALVAGVVFGSLALAGSAWGADIREIEELSPDAQQALKLLANELGGGEIGIVDFTIVSGSGEYPQRTVLINGKAAVVVSIPFQLTSGATVENVTTETTITTTVNPKCIWKEIDGDWVLLPSPPCQS